MPWRERLTEIVTHASECQLSDYLPSWVNKKVITPESSRSVVDRENIHSSVVPEQNTTRKIRNSYSVKQKQAALDALDKNLLCWPRFCSKKIMITDEQKLYIANGYDNKISPKVIATILGLKDSTLRSYWCRFKQIRDLPPKITTPKSKITAALGIKIKNHISETPKTTQKKILKAANETISPSKQFSRTTLRRFLEKNQIVKKKSSRKPIITEPTKKKRMEFVKKWLRNGKSELGNILWSDETTVKSHPNTRRECAYVNQKDPALFQAKVHSGGISQMFWGCVSEHGTGPLITIDGTMDQKLYLEVLQKFYIPELKAGREAIGRRLEVNARQCAVSQGKIYNCLSFITGSRYDRMATIFS